MGINLMCKSKSKFKSLSGKNILLEYNNNNNNNFENLFINISILK